MIFVGKVSNVMWNLVEANMREANVRTTHHLKKSPTTVPIQRGGGRKRHFSIQEGKSSSYCLRRVTLSKANLTVFMQPETNKSPRRATGPDRALTRTQSIQCNKLSSTRVTWSALLLLFACRSENWLDQILTHLFQYVPKIKATLTVHWSQLLFESLQISTILQAGGRRVRFGFALAAQSVLNGHLL